MDILNFISWIKAGNYRTTLPTDTQNLLAIGAKDPNRDDGWLPLAVNAAPLQSLYSAGTVTQLTSITTAVTLNTFNGIITSVSSTLAGNAKTFFTVNNSNVTTASRIIVSAEYDEAATGIVVLGVSDIATGTFKVVISNGGNAALDNVVKVHFMIIN
tara:strand:- start:105 stop:575 length:471 start_codon:yes stop_codon:yes gene_type:complete